VRASLPRLARASSGYEIQPLPVMRAGSLNFFRENSQVAGYGEARYERAGWWWAFTLSFQEEIPPNEVPQLAVSASNLELDTTVNAELPPTSRRTTPF